MPGGYSPLSGCLWGLIHRGGCGYGFLVGVCRGTVLTYDND